MNSRLDEIIEEIVTEATGQKLQTITRIAEGEVNEVYDITLVNAERVIVRISRRVDSQELQREGWAIAQCAANGVPVPQLLLIKDRLDLEEPLAFSVHRWIEGETLSAMIDRVGPDSQPLKDIMRQLGELLRQVHAVRTEGFGWLDAAGRGEQLTLADYFGEITDNAAHYLAMAKTIDLDPALMARAVELLESGKEEYAAVKESCLTHADFSGSNILVHNGQVTGIIDWGLASGGCPVFDLAHWDYGVVGDALKPTTQWLMEGYFGDRTISEAEKKLIQLYQIKLALIRTDWYVSQGNQSSLRWHRDRLIDVLT